MDDCLLSAAWQISTSSQDETLSVPPKSAVTKTIQGESVSQQSGLCAQTIALNHVFLLAFRGLDHHSRMRCMYRRTQSPSEGVW